MENLRLTQKREEIIKIFESASAQKTEVILWQKLQHERKMILAELKFVNQEDNTLLFKSLNNINFSFIEESSLQVKSEFRSIFFKGKIQLLRDNLLIMQIPSEVQVLESRENLRRRASLQRDQWVTLEKEMKGIGGIILDPLVFEFKILDVTTGGASLEVPSQELHDLDQGDHLFLSAISAIGLPHKIEGEIVYIIPLQLNPQGPPSSHERKLSLPPTHYRMGIKFLKGLPEPILGLFQGP